jgi:hypothetical protein
MSMVYDVSTALDHPIAQLDHGWYDSTDASHLQHVQCSSQGALLASGFTCCNQCLQIKSVRPVERESASSTSLKILEAF